MHECFDGIYKDRKVLITGHTGFKGSWLSLWLQKMGADIYGYSLDVPTIPSHYNELHCSFPETMDDICNYGSLQNVITEFEPEIVFHLAAQPLVKFSYDSPRKTFETNVMGTVNVLEAIRQSNSVKVSIIITTDKCYENNELYHGYQEDDRLGGHDPYSASKACAELAVSSYVRSFDKSSNTLIASCRAGNVIGGGDWANDRLIPDIVRAASENKAVIIRSPEAVRPWQHVLESLSGYLLLGQRLLENNSEYVGAWNFGPTQEGNKTVRDVVNLAAQEWSQIAVEYDDRAGPHEAHLLMLNCEKAQKKLNWIPVWDSAGTSISKTISWYKEYYRSKTILTESQLYEYIDAAKRKGVIWV